MLFLFHRLFRIFLHLRSFVSRPLRIPRQVSALGLDIDFRSAHSSIFSASASSISSPTSYLIWHRQYYIMSSLPIFISGANLIHFSVFILILVFTFLNIPFRTGYLATHKEKTYRKKLLPPFFFIKLTSNVDKPFISCIIFSSAVSHVF